MNTLKDKKTRLQVFVMVGVMLTISATLLFILPIIGQKNLTHIEENIIAPHLDTIINEEYEIVDISRARKEAPEGTTIYDVTVKRREVLSWYEVQIEDDQIVYFR